MKFTVREAILLSLLVAIPMGSWWFVFRPRKAQIEEARHEIDQKRSRLLEMSRADEAIVRMAAGELADAHRGLVWLGVGARPHGLALEPVLERLGWPVVVSR